jgi:hypothetical protein
MFSRRKFVVNRHGMLGQQIAYTMRLAMLCSANPPKRLRSEYFGQERERIPVQHLSPGIGVVVQASQSSFGNRACKTRCNS